MEKVKKTKTSYAAPAVDCMLDILELMSATPRPFGPTELSKKLNISNNLAFRVLKRMTERGYAEATPEGLYRLGSRFFSIGMSLYSSFDLRRKALKHLESLCEASGETCQIQIPDGDEMLVLDTVMPSSSFFLHVVPGSRLKYHANAFAKAVLAFRNEDEVKTLLEGKMLPLTKNTLTNPDKFISELEAIRTSGLAYDKEEYIDGVFCIGAPIFDISGNVCAGAGITGLSLRFSGQKKKVFEKSVLLCAEKISRDIGYSGEFFKSLKGIE